MRLYKSQINPVRNILSNWIKRKISPQRLIDMERMVDTIPISLVAFDRNFKLLAGNATFYDLFRQRRDELVGKSLWELLSLELVDKKRIVKKLVKVIQTAEPIEIEKIDCRLPSGRKIVNIRAIKMSRRRDDNAILLIDDITEKVRFAEELRQVQKMSALGHFVAEAAHEINNPLNIVTGNAQYLLEKFQKLKFKNFSPKDFKDLIETLNVIYKHSMRCGQITRNLLMFGRKETGPHKVPTDINQRLEGILSIFGRQLELSQINVEKKMFKLPLVLADSFQIDQVFMNIIINAAQAMLKGGKLTIATFKADQRRIEIKITDTGVGIPKENINRVFEPFFTTRGVGEGTGLGLSVVYSIIKNHRGDIRIESQPGQGTTVTISLPIAGNQRRSNIDKE